MRSYDYHDVFCGLLHYLDYTRGAGALRRLTG